MVFESSNRTLAMSCISMCWVRSVVWCFGGPASWRPGATECFFFACFVTLLLKCYLHCFYLSTSALIIYAIILLWILIKRPCVLDIIAVTFVLLRIPWFYNHSVIFYLSVVFFYIPWPLSDFLPTGEEWLVRRFQDNRRLSLRQPATKTVPFWAVFFFS